MPLWIAWDSFEFEKACCVNRYSLLDPCAFSARSYYAPLWCDLCNTSSYNVSSCPYYACYAHFDASLPLTQCTGFEVGESFGLGASFGMNDDLCGFDNTLAREHNLVGCWDLFVHEGSSSLSYENVLPNSLEHAYVSIVSSPPSSSSPEYAFDVPIDNSEICESNVDMGHEEYMFNVLGGNVYSLESLGYFRGYDAALDPYCINLVDAPRKILWNNFFSLILCMLSYLQACEPHAVAFDKLLRDLMAYDLSSRVLNRWSG